LIKIAYFECLLIEIFFEIILDFIKFKFYLKLIYWPVLPWKTHSTLTIISFGSFGFLNNVSGVPMIFYGDEIGYTNDYSYRIEPGKSYDNRWMHRPVIDWEKNKWKEVEHTTENRIFSATQKLIAIRKHLPVIADQNNLAWLPSENKHVIGFLRTNDKIKLYYVVNFSREQFFLPWFVLRERSTNLKNIFDHWQNRTIAIADDDQYLCFEPYAFYLLEKKV